MTKKSSLKRVAHYAGAFLLAGAVVGCGDDGNNNDADAGVDGGGGIDSGVDATPCEGHGCPGGVGSPFQLPEGGEFRLERLQTSADGAFYLASQAFFFTGQTPDARDIERPNLVLELRQEIKDLGYKCIDRRDGNLFDNGASPEAQAIVNTREYFDLGASVSLTNTDDGTDVITMAKRTNDVDLSAHLMHPIVYRGPDAADVERNTSYKPGITGSAEYPLLDLKFGETAAQEELADEETGVGEPQIYMPAAFTMVSPTEAEYFTPGGMTFTKGEDMELTYTSDPPPEDWPIIIPFVAFVNMAGKVTGVCIKQPTAALPKPDNGEVTIPYEVLEIAEQDTAGFLLLGRFTHAAWEEQEEKNRIDLIAIECKAGSGFKIEEPTGN